MSRVFIGKLVYNAIAWSMGWLLAKLVVTGTTTEDFLLPYELVVYMAIGLTFLQMHYYRREQDAVRE